jgi:Ca2+:H+ antiporter
MITVILCVFLLSYVYGEGKSNYFKGSILVLTYFFVVAGFFLSSYGEDADSRGVDPYDTLAIGSRERTLLTKMAELKSV